MRHRHWLMTMLVGLLVAALVPLSGPATAAEPAGTPPERVKGIPGTIPVSEDADLAAWQRLQYGMFIHWGLYSELGGVWQDEPVRQGYSEQIQMWANIPEADYRKVAERFRPDRFDPKTICSLAKDAGMQYVVITSKHHDGFSMFDTGTTDYNVVDATPYGRDPLKLLADECRSQGLKFGFYFSLVDWHQGHAFDGNNNNPIPPAMEPVIKAQLRELMTNYGEIAEVWFDMSSPTKKQSEAFASVVRELQPHAVINSRIWNNVGDFRTLGDNEIPSVAVDGAWQTPASIYHSTWGYRSWQVRDDLPGKVRDLVKGLASVRARGGNYLLNIGPRGDGSIVEFEADVLRGMGAWLKRHPGAVLGASPTRFGGQPWGEVTANGHDLFLHVTRWPADGELRLPGLATEVRRVLEDGAGELGWRRDGTDLVVTLPADAADEVLPVIRVELAGNLRIVPTRTVADTEGAWVLSPEDIETGYSYADNGAYSSTRRTVVRHTAYLRAHRGGPASIALAGRADPAARYRVRLGGREQVVTGEQLVGSAVGPFVVQPGRVLPLTITRAEPEYTSQDLGVSIDAVMVGLTGTAVAWSQPPNPVELGATAPIPVHVTNLSSRTVTGQVGLDGQGPFTLGPAAAVTVPPGATRTQPIELSVSREGEPGTYRLHSDLDTDARVLGLTNEVNVVLPNVAVGKPATQSSTAWGGAAGRAVDGNTGGDYFGDNSTTHTAEPSNQAWWQVDLQKEHMIDQIEIWNRTDCCSERLAGYWVLVSETPITSSSLSEARKTPGVTAIYQPNVAGRPTSIDLGKTPGRYVRIQLESHTNPLALAEVKVRSRLAAE
ncbi:alpha-L-fucosidase [Streptomyces sp. NPDC056231]|uniref:alpha-L-fucosidase n=1 Tax=Streptomyces sp. NPDC056231 TaxID=3345755 RepID=UPI003AAAE96E